MFNVRMFCAPVDKQVFLHSEAVCAAVTSPGVAFGPPRGARLPGICRWVLLVTVQLRQIATFPSQSGELTGLLPHPGGVDHQGVLCVGEVTIGQPCVCEGPQLFRSFHCGVKLRQVEGFCHFMKDGSIKTEKPVQLPSTL